MAESRQAVDKLLLDDDSHQKWRSDAKKRGVEIRAAVVTRLHKLRKSENLSNRQLSIQSGLSRATIRNIESGLQSPSFETLILLAEGLGVDLSLMLSEEIELHPRAPQT